ncbi:MAG TPA: hypothetical protein VLK29_02500 [Luteimonas sp.]|nr:hypothetical protein [Luteimonas sp.]
MSDAPDKPWYLKLPTKFAATVFFLVALTTLIGNIMEIDEKRRAQEARDARAAGAAPATATAVPAGAATAPVPAPVAAPVDTGPRRMALQLDRIVVGADGSIGTTDWRFAVEADGQPLFVLQQDALDDVAGRNVARPTDAGGTLRVARDGGARVTVKGWRGSRLRLAATEPDATGEGMLTADGDIAPIPVQAGDPRQGAFVLHFSARTDD